MMYLWQSAWEPAASADPEESRKASHKLLENGIRKLYNEKGIIYLLYDSFGRPYLQNHPDLYISISHASGCAAAAAADVPIGVDTEPVRAFSPYAARRALTPAEREALARAEDPQTLFFRLWTLKESYVKAKGVGLSYGLARVSFTVNGTEVECSDAKYECGSCVENGIVTSYCMQRRQ